MGNKTAYRVTLAVVTVVAAAAVVSLLIGIFLEPQAALRPTLLSWGGILAPLAFVLLLLCLIWRSRLNRTTESQ